jgi:excinuclease ABC subunit C
MLDRPPPSSIPDTPGSYQFKDAQGVVLYVGKAHSLRQRLGSYFASPDLLHPKVAQMVENAESVEWIQVKNDAEALLLEYNLIKEHQPRFNIRLRDDKSYPFLAITLDEEWPRAMVMRGQKRKGVRYFGPYTHAYAIRETLDLLIRSFPIRTCSNGKFKYHKSLGRPCLLYHIERCSGPCIDAVERQTYDQIIEDLSAFLNGNSKPIISRLESEMNDAANGLDFERAARLRDRLTSVSKAIEKQQIVGDERAEWDVFSLTGDDFEASIQIFFVRNGRVVGRKGFIVDRIEPLNDAELIARLLQEHYDEATLGIPANVIVPEMPDDADALVELLKEKRQKNVEIAVPVRGDKKALLETVKQNANQALQQHRMRRANDHNSRAKALQELQDVLALPEFPLRIECYDMSHIQGSDYVGSMVVFEDGVPKKSDYRRFKVKSVEGNDDYAAMGEVLRRRLTRLIEERTEPSDMSRKFAYPPQLLVVDGGKGQLHIAEDVLSELGFEEEIPLASLAKQFEEIYVPGRSEPIRIPRGSEALYLLQRIRDEAHRFAVTFHRSLRGKRMTASELDEIAGLGEVRRDKLLKEFGSMKELRAASIDQLHAIKWLPNTVGDSVYAALHK